jgi:sulfocyanin
VRVNEFLSYHPDTRAVQLRLVAGYSGANNTLNINGATEGAHTVTIPVGWRVEAVLENRVDLPHSAVVLAAVPRLPETPGAAAFPGAQTAAVTEGAGMMTSRPLSFVATHAGSYQIVCGVPYHAQAGMWIRLVVSDQAKTPEYTIRSRG